MHNNEISNFINTYYDVKFPSKEINKTNMGDAEIFLLGDIHNCIGHHDVNSYFIDKFYRDRDVVLTECIDSMKEVNTTDSKMTVWLKPETKILGWDSKRCEEGCKFLDESRQSCRTDVSSINIAAFNNLFLIAHILNSDSAKIERQNVDDYLTTERILDDVTALSSEQNASFFKFLGDSFPERTKSMIGTIDKAKKEFNKVFLIAGKAHLQNNFPDPNFSLDSFYKFLKDKKALILTPKPVAVKRSKFNIESELYEQLEKVEKRFQSRREKPPKISVIEI